MDFEKLIIELAIVLDKLKIPYAITGGYAVSIWGRLRATFDIDVIIELSKPKVPQLVAALKKISELSYVDESLVRRAVDTKNEFNFIHPESGIKIDFWVLGNDEFSASKLKRRLPQTINEKKIYFVSPEDLILSKLQWHKASGSEKQFEDVKSILAIQKELNWDYLEKWSKKQSTVGILASLRKE